MEWNQKKSSDEQQLLSDLRDMKKELAQISMVDEFARHAKLQRKITKSQEDLKKICEQAYNLLNSKWRWTPIFSANSRMLKTTAKKAGATQIVNLLLVRLFFKFSSSKL